MPNRLGLAAMFLLIAAGTTAWKIGGRAQVKAKNQPACPVRRGVNMVACDNWSPSLTFRVDIDGTSTS